MTKITEPYVYRALLALVVVVTGLLLLTPSAVLGSPTAAPPTDGLPTPQADASAPSDAAASPVAQPASPASRYNVYLPAFFSLPLSYRLGFGGSPEEVYGIPQVGSLNAGWYVDWSVKATPLRPNQMEFVQVIRVHQKLTCPLYSAHAHDRTLCPYATPLSYVFHPSVAMIEAALRANPGSLWFIGNEMDRRDWVGGGQDEMLPETYAVAYHDLYYLIKGIDPTAKVAIGGVIQATPLRLEYLTKIWDTYQQRYGAPMPVDVWNVHNFILKEHIADWGASIPPGSPAQTGVLYPIEVGGDDTHVSMVYFDRQIRAFRQWMKNHGQQHKPLVVSEYGVLYCHIDSADTPQEVQDFMVQTFDYFLDATDSDLGYPADDYRLVQRWAWYSLDDIGSGFNPYSALIDPRWNVMTSTGERFRTYSLTNLARLAQP